MVSQDFGAKLDKLFAYTHTINEHDVWVHDHECGWGGERFIAGLAKLWKAVLKKPDVRRRRLGTSLLPSFQRSRAFDPRSSVRC